jgi:hypothetical protein
MERGAFAIRSGVGMSRSKIIGLSAWFLAGLGAIFRQAISSAFGKIADTMFRDDFASRVGKFVTFTLADVLILAAFGLGLAALFWPFLSRLLQTEIERKSLPSPKFHHRVYVDCQFELPRDAKILSKSDRDVFVDCTFSGDVLGFVDCGWTEGYRLNAKGNVLCSVSEILEASEYIPVIKNATLINTQTFVGDLYLEEMQAAAAFGNNITHVKTLDMDSIRPKPWQRQLREKMNNFKSMIRP